MPRVLRHRLTSDENPQISSVFISDLTHKS